MAFFLVDYENVNAAGLKGLKNLTREDRVVIFYTKNRNTMTFELSKQLCTCKAEVQMFEATVSTAQKPTVKNALDLQLSMYAGFLIGQYPRENIFIISNDKDFYVDLSFFSHQLRDARSTLVMRSSIEDALSLPHELQTQVAGLLESKDVILVQQICVILASSDDLQALHTSLIKTIGNDGTKEVYRKLKPSFSTLRKLVEQG